MKRRIQLLVDSSRDSDAAATQAINMADRFDAALIATEIRNSRRFESYRKTEESRQLFQKQIQRISNIASDHGVEISDMRSKAVIDQPKDILKISQKINPNVVISSAMDGRSSGPGLSIIFCWSKTLNMMPMNTRISLYRLTARLISRIILRNLQINIMQN
jgi:hypothetical protein